MRAWEIRESEDPKRRDYHKNFSMKDRGYDDEYYDKAYECGYKDGYKEGFKDGYKHYED